MNSLSPPTPANPQDKVAYAIKRNGKSYAGVHHIIDMWGPRRINDAAYIEMVLKESVNVARATLLHVHTHSFKTNGGVSGVAVLAESHISVHTWPELGFAAFDIFTCGNTDPRAAIANMTSAFAPDRVEVREILRGEKS